jgi:hypothetical protein
MIASNWNPVPLSPADPLPNLIGYTIKAQYTIAQTTELGISDKS